MGERVWRGDIMTNLKMFTMLATTAALALATSGASATSLIDENVDTSFAPDTVLDDTVDAEVIVKDDLLDGDVPVDDGGIVPDEVVVEDKVPDEDVVLGGRDLDGVISPEERNAGELENPDVIFYTMAGGGAEDFGSGAAEQAADLAVEQAADRALERIDVAPPAPVTMAPTKKN